ncbi:TPA: hypothetical protein ACH3X1_013243 [Trebouxia sp. C0004]
MCPLFCYFTVRSRCIAGQVPYDTTDKSYKGQTEQVLKLINTILEEGGSSKKNILKVCSFLQNIDEGADEYNAAWDAWCDRENLPVSCDSYSLPFSRHSNCRGAATIPGKSCNDAGQDHY